MADFTHIPVIDISALSGGSDSEIGRTVAAIADACETAGFFYVANHGAPEDCVAGVFDAAQ